MALPAEAEHLRAPLMREYERAWQRVVGEMDSLASDPRNATRVARLREMRSAIGSEMTRLRQVTQDQVPGVVRGTYEMGWATGVIESGALQSVSFDMINRDAVAAYADGLTERLLASTHGVEDSVRSLARSLARDEGLRALIEGDTAVGAGRSMTKALNEHGLWAVTYNDGSKHGLAEYSQMAIRTTTGEAYNDSLIEGARSEGVEFYEIFDGPDCGLEFHDDGSVALGMVVDAKTAQTYLLSHPNCRRAFGPRPDIKTAAQAAGAKGHVTAYQIAAQRKADEARRELQRRQSARRARLARRRGNGGPSRGTRGAGPRPPRPVKPRPGGGAAQRRSLEDLMREEPVSIRSLSDEVSATNDVWVNEYADGSKVVVKEMQWSDRVDREVLGGRVAEALGFEDARVIRVGEDRVAMRYVDGEVGARAHNLPVIPRGPVPGVTDTLDGRRIGVVDYLTGNPDRHNYNWLVKPDGSLHPIDHDLVFSSHGENVWRTSAFAQEVSAGTLDQVDLGVIGGRLENLRGEFESTGNGSWFSEMMSRFTELEGKSSMDGDRLLG